MNRNFLCAVSCVWALGFSWAAWGDFSLDLESGAVWNSKADVQIPSNAGTRFSLRKDLGGDNPTEFLRARATWHLSPKHEVSLLYAPLEMNFGGRFDRSVRFAGSTFAAGVDTEGTYRFDSYRLTYRYNFLSDERLVAGIGLTAKLRDAEVRLVQGGTRASDANRGFVPLLNYRVQWKFADAFSLLTEGDALGAPQGYAIDAAASVQWHVNDRMSFRVGYRLLDGGADNDTVYTFSRFHYSTAGVSFRF
jgi:hypothetical protein